MLGRANRLITAPELTVDTHELLVLTHAVDLLSASLWIALVNHQLSLDPVADRKHFPNQIIVVGADNCRDQRFVEDTLRTLEARSQDHCIDANLIQYPKHIFSGMCFAVHRLSGTYFGDGCVGAVLGGNLGIALEFGPKGFGHELSEGFELG